MKQCTHSKYSSVMFQQMQSQWIHVELPPLPSHLEEEAETQHSQRRAGGSGRLSSGATWRWGNARLIWWYWLLMKTQHYVQSWTNIFFHCTLNLWFSRPFLILNSHKSNILPPNPHYFTLRKCHKFRSTADQCFCPWLYTHTAPELLYKVGLLFSLQYHK